MPDEVLDLLGDVFVNNNIGIFRKMTFLQFVERFKDDPRVLNYIQIKGDLLREFQYQD